MSVAAAGMTASAVSAYIQPIDPPMPPINFPYNPGKYTIVTKGKWRGSIQPATNGPEPQWLGVEPPGLDVDMLLDAFSVPPIPPSLVIEQLKLLTLPTALSMATESSCPPIVVFGWGPNIILDQAVVESVTVEYQRFLLGVPVRANVKVHLISVPLPAPLGPTNPTSGGLAPRRTRTVVEGDSLASIAHQEYRDPNKWRALAEANNIDDPMRVKVGTVLTVPDRREAEALS
jgi:Contractile injection system tube protein/LysM domain